MSNFVNQLFLFREMSEEEVCNRAKFDLRVRDFEWILDRNRAREADKLVRLPFERMMV